MESSRQPAGVFKGRVVDSHAQRHKFRCTCIESLMEDEDSFESSVRYVDSKQATRSSRENGHSLEAWGQTLGFHKIDYAKVWTWLMDRPEEYRGESFDLPHHGLLDDYCVRDVEVTAKLYLKLVNDFNEKQFSLESLELEHSVAAIIAQQERNGFKLDQIYATCLLTDIKSRVAEIYERMQSRWPPVTVERYSDKTGKRLKDSVVTFNPGSRQQISQKLIEMGWKPKKFTEKGQVMIDETILDEIIKEH